MRAVFATIILALQPAPGAAHVNAPASISASGAPAPAEAQEERRLGPWAGAEPDAEPAAAPDVPRAWGVGAGEIARVVIALAAVLGLLLVARAAIRRMGGLSGGGRPGGIMNILGRYPVARGQSLLLLRVGAGRILLVHQGRQSMTTLAEVSDADEVARLVARIEAGSVRPDRRFQSTLSRMATDESQRSEIVDLTRRGARPWSRRAPA